jgi:O-antigen/teichoic acid export membrane protein
MNLPGLPGDEWTGLRVTLQPSAMRVVYLGSMVLATALGALKAFVFADLFDPREFGQYSAALLVFSVAGYLATAGLAEGLGRQVPMLRGQGRIAEAVDVRNASIVASIILAAGVGVLCAIGVAVYARLDPDFGPVVWVGVMLAATIPCNLLLIDLAGREMSTEYGLMLFLKNALSLVLGVGAIQVMGVSGALIGEALAVAVTAVAIALMYSRDLRLLVTRSATTQAVRVARIGVPFMLSSVVLMLTLTMDRWVVQSQFGLLVFGQYSFAFLLWTSGMLMGNILSVYFGPRIVAMFARTPDVSAVFRYVRNLSVSVAAVLLTAMAPVLWAAYWLIDVRYPEYASVKGLLVPVYLSVVCWTANFYGSLFVIQGEGRFALWMSVASGVVGGVVFAGVVWLEGSLMSYAVGFFCCRLLYLLGSIVTAKMWLFRGRNDAWQLV